MPSSCSHQSNLCLQWETKEHFPDEHNTARGEKDNISDTLALNLIRLIMLPYTCPYQTIGPMKVTAEEVPKPKRQGIFVVVVLAFGGVQMLWVKLLIPPTQAGSNPQFFPWQAY